MTRVQELRLRVQRLPELTQKATVVATTRKTVEGLAAAQPKLASSRTSVIELRRIVAEIRAPQLEPEIRKCCEAINKAADQASQLKAAITKAGGGLLPPDVEKRVQNIGTAAQDATSSKSRLWDQIEKTVALDRGPLLAIAERLGISGAAEVSSELRAVQQRGVPKTPNDADRVIACHRHAGQVLDSLPREGPVGGFLEKLVRGDGAPLTELSNVEVREFVKQHSLEERLVVRLATT